MLALASSLVARSGNRPATNFVALFGCLSDASVERVGLENVQITGAGVVAALAGVAYATPISQVYATGSILGDNNYVGGLVGWVHDEVVISDSYTQVAVTADDVCGIAFGKSYPSDIVRVYASGTTIGCPSEFIGYPNDAIVVGSFFDCDIVGNCLADGAATTAEMQTPALYIDADWDLDEVWGFAASGTYPCLRWQDGCEEGLDTDEDGTPDALDECPTDANKIVEGDCGCGTDDGSAACVAGSPCEADQDCLDRATDESAWTCSETFPGGFCRHACGAEDACPEGTYCEETVGCVPECDEEDECIRDGLECLLTPAADFSGEFCRPTCALECAGSQACDSETVLCRACLADDSICNDFDDDCDVSIDEDFVSTEVGCGVGSCARTGSTACVDGELTDDCTPGSPAGADTSCNNADEDCDGRADEAYSPTSTSCGVGACVSSGTSSCVAGVVQSGCTPGTPAANDTSCNGVDNDCNGVVDEDYVPTGTTCSTGACAATGSLICSSGSVVNTCSPGAPASSDITCNGVDDDCDSAIDDNYQPVPSGCQQAGCLATGFIQCVSGAPQDQCSTLGTCVEETDCDDDVDNDEDDATDCADVDCATDALCEEPYCANHVDDNGNGLIDCADPGCDGAPGCIVEICGNSLDDDADHLTDCADLDCNHHASCLTLPPTDLSEVAPPLETTIAVKAIDALSYLFEGDDPVQRGVQPEEMVRERIALLSGRVMVSGGAPLAGVMVDILGREELGLTHTNEDGYFYMAVNAGGTITARFQLGGYIPAQRATSTEFGIAAAMEDVILLPRSSTVTEVDLSGASTVMQVVSADLESDDDGERRAVLMIPPGTQAWVYDANRMLVPVTDFNLRITEHTVGEQGNLSMPASLPPTSAYTYAVDITGDEALYKYNGIDTWLSNPAIFYIDNFMNVAPGSGTPSGYFDNEAGIWRAIDSGTVLEIVGEPSGVAAIDLTGDGVAEGPTELAAIGISTEERQALSALYNEGKSLRRVPIPHFSTWDHNDGFWPEGDTPPPDAPPNGEDPLAPDCNSPMNSTIDCFSRVLAEDVAIPGTPFALHYDTTHVEGRLEERTVRVPLKTDNFDELPVQQVVVKITPPMGAPVTFSYIPPSVPDKQVWTWDGLDQAGRPLWGVYEAKVSVSYSYRCIPTSPPRFGSRGSAALRQPGSPGPLVSPRQVCGGDFTRESSYPVEHRDMRVEGLGGWSINAHHRQMTEKATLHRGDGKSFQGSRIPGSEAVVSYGNRGAGDVPKFATGPDGTVYFIGNGNSTNSTGTHGVWRRRLSGEVSLVMPSTTCQPWEASEPRLCRAFAIAATSSNRLFVADWSHDSGAAALTSLRIVEINGATGAFVKRVAGAEIGFSGEGGPARDARFNNVCDMEADADGSLYILNCHKAVLQRITPDGRLERVAGTGIPLGFAVQTLEDDATHVPLSFLQYVSEEQSHQALIGGIGLDRSGGVYIAQTGLGGCTVLHLDRGGRLSVAVPSTGCGTSGQLMFQDVAVSPTGALILANYGTPARVLRLTPDPQATAPIFERLMGLPAGFGPVPLPPLPNVYPAKEALGNSAEVHFGPDGQLYVSEQRGLLSRIRKLNIRSLRDGAAVHVASPDGSEIYEFDENGRHAFTKHPLTGANLLSFEYDEDGLLETITDVVGNVTTIERDTEGVATAIVAPFAQRTELEYDASGYLASIETSENDAPHSFTYDATGLMTQQIDPGSAVHTYEHDEFGRVELTEDAEGGSWTFSSTSGLNFEQVTMTTELGRVTTYRNERLSTGETKHIVTLPGGAQNTRVMGVDGVAKTTMANGTVILQTTKRHPLYGADVPLIDETITTQGSLASPVTRTLERTVTVTAPSGWFSISALTDRTTEGTYQTTRTYNASARTWTITSPGGRVVTETLDTLGRLSSSTRAGTLPVSIDYDPEGRIEAIEQGARVTSYEYDAIGGFLESYTDPANQTTTYTTDDVGRITQIEDPNGDITALAYDDESNLVGVTPADRSLHELSYSSVDLYDGYVAPAQGSVPRQTTLTYDADRALTEVEQPDGTSLLYSYNATTGLLHQASIPGAGTYTYGYNAGAQLASISTTGGFGNATLEYGLGATRGQFPLRVSTSGQFFAGAWQGVIAGNVVYGYSNRLLLATVQPKSAVNQQQDGYSASYTWDGDKLLSSITPATPSTGPTLSFSRSSLDGHVTGTTIGTSPNTVTTSYDVDVSSGSPGTGDLEGMSASVAGTPVFSVSYVRDDLGRIERLDETVLSTSITRKYFYDGAGRLIAVLDGSDAVVAEYEYDGNGARVRALTPNGEAELGTEIGCGVGLTTPVDAQDRLCRYGDYEYTYDDNGRLFTKTNLSTSAVSQYGYDGLGRLRSVVLPGPITINYVHDALGRRVGKVKSGGLVKGWRYGVDPLRPLAQLDNLGLIEKTYVYGTSANVPELIIDRVGGAAYRVIVDHLGSVRLVVNVATGVVAQQLAYDELGNVLLDTNPGFQPFGFAGGLYDADTGLVRFGARDYDPATGRWTAKDPVLFDGGSTNLYEYAMSDPVNHADVTGLSPQGDAIEQCKKGCWNAYQDCVKQAPDATTKDQCLDTLHWCQSKGCEPRVENPSDDPERPAMCGTPAE